ncbi:hypothetical protein FB45DRAFT_33056 [Roridomyces roridus]|uniref:Uncharacterized protein n=1 Tax=Roridomyces roridus TaxID=1738132 RepID=A0AAD7CNB7_9AGAR|nr:hypothetical protein FB45DRAFT_33056 [Roridomyces roridus]
MIPLPPPSPSHSPVSYPPNSLPLATYTYPYPLMTLTYLLTNATPRPRSDTRRPYIIFAIPFPVTYAWFVQWRLRYLPCVPSASASLTL